MNREQQRRGILHRSVRHGPPIGMGYAHDGEPPKRGPSTPSKRGPLDAVEREIVMAEIAYLKQLEIDNGDRAKWEASQPTFRASRLGIALGFALGRPPTFRAE